jgi:FAD-dependent oxidoreductase domain-containing protein 1
VGPTKTWRKTSFSQGAGKRWDVLIIGAGVIGLSAAYHIKQGNPSASVLVIDGGATSAQGETAKSVAAIRDMFTSDLNRLLAGSTIRFYKHVQSELGFNLNLELIGYLWLLTEKGSRKFTAMEAGIREQGVRFREFEREELAKLMPDLVLNPASEQSKVMGLERIERAVQGLDCGTVSPELIAKFYEEESKKLGVEFQFRMAAKSLHLDPEERLGLPGEPFVWQEKVFGAVETNSRAISADTIVIAAGTGTPALLDPVGIDCLVKPKKRQVFRLRGAALERLLGSKGFNEQNTSPFIILPKGGVFFRPVRGERSFWAGAADQLGRGFMLEEEPAAEESYYTYNIAPILSEYFPCFTNLRPVSSWAGLYDVNSLDSTPVIDRVSNCIVATGMSGSGIMKADAVGRIVAAIYEKKEEAVLHDGRRISTKRLGLTNRIVSKEELVL